MAAHIGQRKAWDSVMEVFAFMFGAFCFLDVGVRPIVRPRIDLSPLGDALPLPLSGPLLVRVVSDETFLVNVSAKLLGSMRHKLEGDFVLTSEESMVGYGMMFVGWNGQFVASLGQLVRLGTL